MNSQPLLFDLSDTRILVLGGFGFIGSYLVERLFSCGATIGVLSRSAATKSSIRPEIATYNCDLLDLDKTVQCFCDFRPTVVFQLAAASDAAEDVAQAIRTVQTNVIGNLHALEAFRLAQGKLYVYGDSCKVFGNTDPPFSERSPMIPVSSYGISKASGWLHCNLYRILHGCNVVSVRPTLVYGPRQAFNLFSYIEDCVKSNRSVCLGGGHQTRDPLFISDLIDALILVLAHRESLNGRIINLGGGGEYSVYQLAQICLEVLNSQLDICVDESKVRVTEMWRSTCDISEARELLNWWPRVDFRTGITKTYNNVC